MARGPARPKGMTDYEWRIYRQLGITLQEAQSRGISRQKARGHGQKTAAPGRGEKAQTRERQRQRGELTDVDRAFLRRQVIRTSPVYAKRRRGRTVEFVEVESGMERYRRAAEAYKRLTPEQRDYVRLQQRELGRAWRANKKFRRDVDRPRPSGADVIGIGGERIEFGENYDFDPLEGEWPDYKDDLAPFYFYH